MDRELRSTSRERGILSRVQYLFKVPKRAPALEKIHQPLPLIPRSLSHLEPPSETSLRSCSFLALSVHLSVVALPLIILVSGLFHFSQSLLSCCGCYCCDSTINSAVPTTYQLKDLKHRTQHSKPRYSAFYYIPREAQLHRLCRKTRRSINWSRNTRPLSVNVSTFISRAQGCCVVFRAVLKTPGCAGLQAWSRSAVSSLRFTCMLDDTNLIHHISILKQSPALERLVFARRGL